MDVWIGGVDEAAVAETEGIAYTIYFSGCSIRCPGCHNKHLWEKESGKKVPVDYLVSEIRDNLELIDTVCILGGEPTEQLEALEDLLIQLQDLPVKIWLYSGHSEEYVKKLDIMKYCDVVKCGPYRADVPPKDRLASGNQYFIRSSRR